MKDFLTDVLKEEEMGFPFGMLNRGLRSVNDVLYGRRAKDEMKTDVQEQEDGYVIDIDLPGFKKEDVKVSLEDGYLTVTAAKQVDNEHGSKSKCIRRERYTGELSRSFYVGDALTKEDVRAKMEHGVLSLNIPKKMNEKLPEENNLIMIEGEK